MPENKLKLNAVQEATNTVVVELNPSTIEPLKVTNYDHVIEEGVKERLEANAPVKLDDQRL